MGKSRAAKAARKVERDRLAGAEFWHGGIGSLAVGDEILPPIEQTGHDPMRSSILLTEARDDRVYFTTDRELARVFASAVLKGRRSGAIYRVEPIGRMSSDPDFPTVGLHARRARILDVEDLTVPLSEEESQRRQAPYLLWDDGRPIYDSEGRVQISWQMKTYGLTQADLDRALPKWTRPAHAMKWAGAVIGERT